VSGEHEVTTGGTLIISRAAANFPDFKHYLETFGFQDVEATSEEKKRLCRLIGEMKPRIVFIESCFYSCATPYMMGRLLRDMPRLRIAAFSIGEFSDDLALWFYFHGLKGYLNCREGKDEFDYGLEEIRKGREYFSPGVRGLIDLYSEWPEIHLDVTRRQMETLLFLCNGFMTKEIANYLNVSRRTVEWHLKELYGIFHVHTKEELIKAAVYLDLFTKKDMSFYGGTWKPPSLPEWAAAKQMLSRRGKNDG
jgi:DNA-binding NarL/FixJ family response regulator